MQSNIKLFYPYTDIENFNDHEKVCISWFYYNRQNPVAPYDQLIQDFDKIEDEIDAKRQKMAINEYFTYDEMNELKKYLAIHPIYSTASFEHDPIYVPYRRKQAPLTTIPRVEKYRRFFPIYQSDNNYPLSFKAVGFYLVKYNFPFCKTYEPGKRMYELYNESVPAYSSS